MDSGSRSAGLWSLYALSLLAGSFSIHAIRARVEPSPAAPAETVPTPAPAPKPTPVKPVLTVARDSGDFGHGGRVSFPLRLDRPAPSRLQIGYRLDPGSARPGRDFAVEPEPAGTVVIEQGKAEAVLMLTRLTSEPTSAHASRSSKPASIAVTVTGGTGVELAAGSSRSWYLPLMTTEFGPPYQVSIDPPVGFRQTDARRNEEIAVVFRLDRPPADHPVSTRFRLKGDAGAADYQVVRPRGAPADTLCFPVGQPTARLVLRRLPGPRGLGDRAIRVSCEPPAEGELVLAPGQTPVTVALPDPAPTLSWSIDPPDAAGKDPRNPASATLHVSMRPPCSAKVVFHYKIVSPNRADDLPPRDGLIEIDPLADIWADEVVKASQALTFPPDDLVFPTEKADLLAMRVQIEPAAGLANPPAPLEFQVHDPDTRTLTGQVLVILALTERLTRDDSSARRELQAIQSFLDQAEANAVRDHLVDRSVFVLDRGQRLHRFRLGSVPRLRPFPRSAGVAEIVHGSTRRALAGLQDRLSPEDQAAAQKHVLIIPDLADQTAEPIVKALTAGLLGRNWWVYWTDPDAGLSPLATGGLAVTIRARANLNEFGSPRPDLPRALLSLLR